MTNYVKSTNFATKDALASGNPLKIVKGAEIDTEFNNIATAVATKADLNSPTLVTPALGTPSSGTLTNCTSLPIDGGTTGTLPVARGGTGVTTSTGSGNVVLSTSPTLVTPALGTPSSGNLANCTFPTLNQNTTGTAAGLSATLSIGSGGTAATTAAGARTSLDVPSTSGSGASGTWGINITGNAAGLSATLAVGSGGTGATSFTSGALLKGAGTSAVTVASASDIVGQIGSTAVQNATNATNATSATNATNATSAATVTTTVASGATGTTQATSDSTTKIATTAFVQNAIGAASGIQVYDSSGTYTFTVPAGVTTLYATVFGGGGGGGGSWNPTSILGAVGGAGGRAYAIVTNLTPGGTVTVTVGAGGNGGNAQNSTAASGSAGNTSSFGSYVTCTGGGGGGSAAASGGGGLPGATGTVSVGTGATRLASYYSGPIGTGSNGQDSSGSVTAGGGGAGLSGGGGAATQSGTALAGGTSGLGGTGTNGTAYTSGAGGSGGTGGGTGGTSSSGNFAPGGGGGGCGGVILQW